MATLKHIASKNSDYTAIEAYLIYQHDAFTGKQLLDDHGRPMLRESYILDTLECGDFSFATACLLANRKYSVEHRKPGGNGNNQHTAAAKKTVPEELCQFDTIPPTASEASVRKQIAERNNVSESYVARSEKFMRGVEIMEQMVPGMQEKILSGQFKVRDADMHRLARADFPNRKQIVHEILHPEDRPAPQSSYSHYSGINYSALEVAVRRIQQDFDFLMRYLPKLPDDSYAKTETLKILKQHKAYMAQFEEMLNDKEIA